MPRGSGEEPPAATTPAMVQDGRRRVAVTGGSGKLGRTVVSGLRDHGHQVVNLDRSGERGPASYASTSSTGRRASSASSSPPPTPSCRVRTPSSSPRSSRRSRSPATSRATGGCCRSTGPAPSWATRRSTAGADRRDDLSAAPVLGPPSCPEPSCCGRSRSSRRRAVESEHPRPADERGRLPGRRDPCHRFPDRSLRAARAAFLRGCPSARASD